MIQRLLCVVAAALAAAAASVAAAAPAAAAAPPNADPVCPPQQRLQTRPGQPLTVTVVCSDPDGDPLAYSLASRSEHATLEQSGPASFVYTSTREFRGDDGLLVLARDGRGGSALVSASIAVVDPAPVCDAPAPLVLRPLRRAETTVACSDPDGGPVRLTAITRGVSFARAAVAGDRVTVLATIAGAGRLRVAATDDDGSVVTFELEVRVEPYPAPRSPAPVCFDRCALGADGAVALGFRCAERAVRASCRAQATLTAGRRTLATTTRDARPGTLSLLLVRLPAPARRWLAAHRRAALTLRASVRGSDDRTRRIARAVQRPR